MLPHCNLNSASTLPTKTAFILSLHMMPFPKPVFVCLCGRFVVGLPVSYDTGSLNLADLVHLPTPDSQTLSEAF